MGRRIQGKMSAVVQLTRSHLCCLISRTRQKRHPIHLQHAICGRSLTMLNPATPEVILKRFLNQRNTKDMTTEMMRRTMIFYDTRNSFNPDLEAWRNLRLLSDQYGPIWGHQLCTSIQPEALLSKTSGR
jgi:hypothetical protein